MAHLARPFYTKDKGWFKTTQKPDTKYVWFSNVSGIWMSGFEMVTLPDKIVS
jgi:hypothetical protein